ncbi:MAG: HxsD-like protein [archaeon]
MDEAKNEVRLFIDTRIYDYSAIIEASQAFTDSCWVALDGDVKNKLFISLSPKSGSIALSTLGYEFYNYVLGLMQNA